LSTVFCAAAFRVAGIDADDVERRNVGELDLVERLEFAAEHEVQQLLGGARSIAGDRGQTLRPGEGRRRPGLIP
jgi:hypothetical protein